jgi:hypothetical protein
MQVCSKQEMLVDFYSMLATHDHFFGCYISLPFRPEFAAGVWRKNNFPLHSWQVFITRIVPMLRLPRSYTLSELKYDFSTSWSCVNRPGLRTNLRWGLHTSHSDLRQWTKPTHGTLKSPLHTATTYLLLRFFSSMVMTVGYSFVPHLCVDFRWAWQPNNTGYQQCPGLWQWFRVGVVVRSRERW